MFNKLASLVLLSSICGYVYAQDFSNIEVIPKDNFDIVMTGNTYAWASTGDRWGKVDQVIKLQANYKAAATNPTDHRTDVRFTYRLCADDKNCHFEGRLHQLSAHQTITGGQEVHVEVVYNKPGNYRLCAETIVEGNDTGNNFANECHTIYVSK